MSRRKTSRIYSVATDRMVKIEKDWSMKFGQHLWYVFEYGPEQPRTLGKFSTFAEARQFVRKGATP
jgi:hypothetical protein